METELLQAVSIRLPKIQQLKALEGKSNVLDLNDYHSEAIKSAVITTVRENDRNHPQITVITNDIFLVPSEDPKGIAPTGGLNIGKYEVIIRLTPASAGMPVIRFKTLSSRQRAYDRQMMHHPHVFQDGDACFGDFLDPIMVALEDGDYFSIIDILVLFLSQAASDDTAGMWWPSWMPDNDCDCAVFMRSNGSIGSEGGEYDDDEDEDEWCHTCDQHTNECEC